MTCLFQKRSIPCSCFTACAPGNMLELVLFLYSCGDILSNILFVTHGWLKKRVVHEPLHSLISTKNLILSSILSPCFGSHLWHASSNQDKKNFPGSTCEPFLQWNLLNLCNCYCVMFCTNLNNNVKTALILEKFLKSSGLLFILPWLD